MGTPPSTQPKQILNTTETAGSLLKLECQWAVMNTLLSTPKINFAFRAVSSGIHWQVPKKLCPIYKTAIFHLIFYLEVHIVYVTYPTFCHISVFTKMQNLSRRKRQCNHSVSDSILNTNHTKITAVQSPSQTYCHSFHHFSIFYSSTEMLHVMFYWCHWSWTVTISVQTP